MTNVSVLTPSYGYGRFIGETIESVIQQRGLGVQHIVQDGGSTDETLTVLRSFGDEIAWISEPDLGQSDALDKALTKATGEWVGWLNADEYYLPDGLRVLVGEGEKHHADVVYGDCVTVDRDGRFIGLRPQHPFSRMVLRLYGPFPASVSVIIRRSALGEEPWDRSLSRVMDWGLYLALAMKGASFLYVPYPVGAFRLHEDQASAHTELVWLDETELRRRYVIPSARWTHRAGTALHRLRKLAAGSYVRQLRAMALRGKDLRWFEGGDGADTFRLLLDRCYGGRAVQRA